MRQTNKITTEMLDDRNRYLMVISNLTDVPSDAILGKSRLTDIVTARHLLMWALTFRCGYSTTAVGIMLHRDHASVVNGRRSIEDGWRDFDKRVPGIVHILKEYHKQSIAQ